MNTKTVCDQSVVNLRSVDDYACYSFLKGATVYSCSTHGYHVIDTSNNIVPPSAAPQRINLSTYRKNLNGTAAKFALTVRERQVAGETLTQILPVDNEGFLIAPIVEEEDIAYHHKNYSYHLVMELYLCSRKRAYSSAEEAEIQVKRLNSVKGENVHVYQCDYNSHYHIGHTANNGDTVSNARRYWNANQDKVTQLLAMKEEPATI